MLYEFALTPDVFDASEINGNSALGVTLVTILRGLAENGSIANLYRGTWIDLVRTERLAEYSPALKDKIIACLDILDNRHRIVPHPKGKRGTPTCELDWLILALDSDSSVQFWGIILGDALKKASGHDGERLIELSEALDSEPWLRRRRSSDIERTIPAYRKALAPMLRYAKAVSLIDPYLSANERGSQEIIRLCVQLIGNRLIGRLAGRVHIHCHIDKQEPEGHDIAYYLNKWEGFLAPFCRTYGHRFRVTLWREKPAGKRFHDRYLLTDQCGVSVQAGLEIPNRRTPGTTTWNLLDEDVRVRQLGEVDRETTPFQFVQERDIPNQ